MNIVRTGIPEVIILEPKVFGDHRGYFLEAFSESFFASNVRNVRFVQDNESRSSYGVVRGLHFQLPPHAQSKLVRAVKGCVRDVAVDIRRGSPTFGRYVATDLSEENHRQMFIPRGFAHGFAVLSDEAVVEYKCDSYYAPRSEGAVLWNDPDLNIDWGLPHADVILSDKDRMHPLLRDVECLFDYSEDYYKYI